jgi:circadian clock protein KaiB
MMNKLNVVPHISDASLVKDNVFNLYVVGESVNSMLALRNLKNFCESHYPHNYQIHLIDVLLSPEQAWTCGVTATPLLVRILPTPTVKIMGNLSDTELMKQVLNRHGE